MGISSLDPVWLIFTIAAIAFSVTSPFWWLNLIALVAAREYWNMAQYK